MSRRSPLSGEEIESCVGVGQEASHEAESFIHPVAVVEAGITRTEKRGLSRTD